MNRDQTMKILGVIRIEPSLFSEEQFSTVIIPLLQLIETLVRENEENKKEIQKLRDEISLLKGEQKKPQILPNKKLNCSSEKERKKLSPHKKKAKK